MFEIIPGILEKDWESIEKKLQLIKPFAKAVHIDILDGKFANNTTFLDPKPFEKYTGEMLFELHMMVDNPLQYVKPFADAGFRRFIGHVEKMPDQVAFVAEAEQYGEVGLAVDGPTPIEAVKVNYEDLDVLLVMTITAGFSGQAFDPKHLEKIKAAQKKAEYLNIEVDGGINGKTIVTAKEHGANRFISTSFLYGAEDVHKQFQLLNNCVQPTWDGQK